MTDASAPPTSEDLREQQEELRFAQAARREDLVVLNAQLDYAKRELAEREAASELDGTDNSTAVTEKEGTIARIERNIRAKTVAIQHEEQAEEALAQRQTDTHLRELQAAEREIEETTPAADARVGEAAFALLRACTARQTLARRLYAVSTLMNDLHERTGKGAMRNLRGFAAPHYDMDVIVSAALDWARSTGHDVDMETWTLTKSVKAHGLSPEDAGE